MTVNPLVSASPPESATEPLLLPTAWGLAFVELNTDDTPIGLLTVQNNMRVIKSHHAIDPLGTVMAPSQSTGVCVLDCADEQAAAQSARIEIEAEQLRL